MSADPSRILDALRGYWHTEALKAAIDIGVFTALDRRARTAGALAKACGADEGRLRRLCDNLVSQRFLVRKNGKYRAAADAARYLNEASPDSLVGSTRFFNEPPVTTAFARLGRSVTNAREDRIAADESLWREFAGRTLRLRQLRAAPLAAELRRRGLGRGRILDVGAGGSPLGISLLARAATATLTVQDRPGVLDVALRHAADTGVEQRVSSLPGDARTVAFGGAYDLVLMVNVLDYFSDADRAALVDKAAAALAPGGTLAIAAPLLHEGRTSPSDAVSHDLLLLALGGESQAFTVRELVRLLRSAGFVRVTRVAALSLVLADTRKNA